MYQSPFKEKSFQDKTPDKDSPSQPQRKRPLRGNYEGGLSYKYGGDKAPDKEVKHLDEIAPDKEKTGFFSDYRRNKIIFAACLMAAIGYGAWWLLTPQSYEECLLKYISDAHSNVAARLVHHSCEREFSKN